MGFNAKISEQNTQNDEEEKTWNHPVQDIRHLTSLDWRRGLKLQQGCLKRSGGKQLPIMFGGTK